MAYISRDGKSLRSSAHDVRTVVTNSHELNYGAAVFRIVYEKLGLPRFFAKKSELFQLDFSLDKAVFCICFFNVDHKLSDPLDLKDLSRRRCIFDFSDIDEACVERTLDTLQLIEPELLTFVNKKVADKVKNRTQMLKHSPNPKVVLKSLSYLIRSQFFLAVAGAGYQVPKEQILTVLYEGTILRYADSAYPEKGFVKVNKAFGRYGTGEDDASLLTVRKLCAIFGVKAQKPMRNAAELSRAFKVSLPFNQEFYAVNQDLPPDRSETDIDLKVGEELQKIEGVDFLFADEKHVSRKG